MAITKIDTDMIANDAITADKIAAGALDTQLAGYLSTNSFATESYVGTAISNLVDSSPATLDTLNELAAALGDDPNFATTTATAIGLKAPIASPSFTGAATFSGTVTATSDVFVTGAGANGTRLDLEASNTAASIIANYGVSAVPLDFYTGALKRMTLDTSGNVGIGIVPSNTFSVGASGTVTTRYTSTDTTTFSLLQFENNGSIVLSADHGNAGANSAIIFKRDGAQESMRIDSSGNVGIGTAAPVASTNKTVLGVQGVWGGQLDIMVGSTVHAQFGTDNFSSGQSCRIQSQDGIVFKTGGSAERMRLSSAGDLTVTGAANFGGNVSLAGAGTSNRYVALLGETNTYAGTFMLQAGGGSATYGGGLTMFGHSHATRPGSVIAGISSGSSGVFAVNNVGIGGVGSDVLTVSAAGSLSLTGPITAPYIYTVVGGSPNMYIRFDGLIMRAGSSLRYKNTVIDATHGLAELLTLRPVTYKSNSEGDLIYGGLIAEEVYAAGLPEFVQYDQDGEPDGLSYGNMVSLCIKAIQEQQTIIEALTARLESLEGDL